MTVQPYESTHGSLRQTVVIAARLCGVVVALVLLTIAPAAAQSQEGAPAARQVEGRIVSVKPSTLIVRTDQGAYFVFVLDQQTERPASLPVGAQVRVDAVPASNVSSDVFRATRVVVSGTAPAGSAAASNVPPQVRHIESQVAEKVRHFNVGVRAGVALDPELVTFGVHATLGPIFSRRLWFRPNVEFAYGEVTTLFAVNLEGIYRLSQTMPRGRWSPYVGGGPTLGFSHRGFSATGSGRSFDFGDFDFHGGINLLAGFEKPSGVFIELKTTIYTDPHVRLLFGYTF